METQIISLLQGTWKIGGRWTPTEAENHINALELQAVFLALKAFCNTCHDVHVQIKSDNTCTVFYINAMWGVSHKFVINCLFRFGLGTLSGIFG